VNIQIDINSYTFDNKLQYWIELNCVKLFYKTLSIKKLNEIDSLLIDSTNPDRRQSIITIVTDLKICQKSVMFVNKTIVVINQFSLHD